jgi:heat shock protein HslJ
VISSRRPRGSQVALAIVAAVLGLAACAAAPSQLAGMEFISVAVSENGAPRPLVADTRIRLEFTDGNLGGNAGCNHFGYSYRIEDGRLVLGEGGMTAMGCDAALHAQDDWLAAFLGSRPTVNLAGSDLRLETDSVVITLRDRELVDPDLPLTGPTWRVESVLTGDMVSSIPPDAVATLFFKDDGTVEVNAGCNRGSGTWASVAGGLEIGPLMLTKTACEKGPAELEGAVLAVLEGEAIAAEIESNVLTLRTAGRGLILRAT